MKLPVLDREARVVERPRFRERQTLTFQDLAAEQRYLIAMRRRHLTGQHAWGIVRGLAIAAAGARLVVQPGVAVDGYGRELVVSTPLALGDDAMAAVGSRWMAVWLLYGCLPDTPAQLGRHDCGPGKSSRWVEAPCVRLTRTDADSDPLSPPGVTSTAFAFAPEQDPPDEGVPVWPIYLGRVERRAGDLRIDLAGRPYCGLVGDAALSPRGGAGLRVGADCDGVAIETAAATEATEPRMRLRTDGANVVEAPTRFSNDVALARATDSAYGVEFRQLPAPPTVAAPWQAYRTSVREDGRTVRELRFEIGNPGDEGDPTRYALSVAGIENDGTLVRPLIVTADCVVAIDGDLDVDGLLVEGPVDVDPTDPRFGAAVLASWARGVVSSALQLDTVYAGALKFERMNVSGQADGTVTWTFRVHNTGHVPLHAIRVEGRIVSQGDVVFDKALDDPFSLEVGSTHEITGSYVVTGTLGQSVGVTITAIGLGPSGAPAQTAFKKRIPLETTPL